MGKSKSSFPVAYLVLALVYGFAFGMVLGKPETVPDPRYAPATAVEMECIAAALEANAQPWPDGRLKDVFRTLRECT